MEQYSETAIVVVTAPVMTVEQPALDVLSYLESQSAALQSHFVPSVGQSDPRYQYAAPSSPSAPVGLPQIVAPAAGAAATSFSASAVAGWLVAGAGSAPATTGFASTMPAIASTPATQPALGTLPILPTDPSVRAAEPGLPLVEVPVQPVPSLGMPQMQPQLAIPQGVHALEETAFAESSLAPVANVADPTRAEPLLAGFSLNFAAVDAALKELVGEVETLSDELVDWFDEAKLSPWSLAAGVAVAAAGGYYLRRRRHSLQAGMGDEEPASWLFLNLQLPRAEL